MIFGVLLVPLVAGLAIPWALRRRRAAPDRAPGAGARQLQGFLGGVAAVALLVSISLGGGGGSGVVPFVAAPVTLVALVGVIALRRGSGRRVTTDAWSWSSAERVSWLPIARTEPTSASEVARSLVRVEARELTSSPWFGAGLGFGAVLYVLFGWVWADEDVQTWTEYVQLAPWFVHPTVGVTVLAAHRAVTRAERDGTAELFDTCPASQTTRTLGLLGAALAPMAALALFLLAMGVTSAVRSPLVHGPVGPDEVADVLSAVLLGAGGLALGVALGRWVPFTLAPVVALFVVGFASLQLNVVGGAGWNPLTPLSLAPAVRGPSPVFHDRPAGWHLLWVAVLVALVAIVAIARHRRDRLVGLGGAAAVALLVVAGIGATRPLSSTSADRIAARVARPEDHQVCRRVGAVELCAFRHHEELLDRLVERAGPIAAALPAGVAPITLRQVYDGRYEALPPEVRRRLAPSQLERPPGERPLTYGEGDVGYDVAFAATGLPSAPDERLLPTVVAGQARGVVALWLLARGLDPTDVARVSHAHDPGSPDAFARGSLDPVDDPCFAPAVVWSAQDLAAARAVLALPEGDVGAVLADWRRWTDPGTGTDELLAALGLAPVGPFDRVEPRPGGSC